MLDFIHQSLHSGLPVCSTLHELLKLNRIEITPTAFLAVVAYHGLYIAPTWLWAVFDKDENCLLRYDKNPPTNGNQNEL